MFKVNMSILKGVLTIYIQEMTEEALQDGLAKFSVEPTPKIHFPLQFTEWRLTKLMDMLVPHFSSSIYMHSKKCGFFKDKIIFPYI